MESAEDRSTRCCPIVDIIVAGRQIGRIRVLLEYPSNECSRVNLRLGPELQETFVNGLAHHVGQANATLTKGPRLTEAFRIEPYVDQTRSRFRSFSVKIARLYRQKPRSSGNGMQPFVRRCFRLSRLLPSAFP
jgi:hypothetical protein